MKYNFKKLKQITDPKKCEGKTVEHFGVGRSYAMIVFTDKTYIQLQASTPCGPPHICVGDWGVGDESWTIRDTLIPCGLASKSDELEAEKREKRKDLLARKRDLKKELTEI